METTDYVSYSLALALKAAGFDEPCDHVYCKWFLKDTDVKLLPKEERNGCHICADAPTLWQAQKWLRERKNIEVNAVWSYEKSDWFTYSSPMCRPPVMDSDVSDTPYTSYEQALSAGIAAALELIENEKG